MERSINIIGDAIFAFWNAPLPERPARGLRHGAQVPLRAQRLNGRRVDKVWRRGPRSSKKKSARRCSVTSDHPTDDYTAIGDNVNIGSRLEGLNKYYGSGILASGEIVNVCSDPFLFRRIDAASQRA